MHSTPAWRVAQRKAMNPTAATPKVEQSWPEFQSNSRTLSHIKHGVLSGIEHCCIFPPLYPVRDLKKHSSSFGIHLLAVYVSPFRSLNSVTQHRYLLVLDISQLRRLFLAPGNLLAVGINFCRIATLPSTLNKQHGDNDVP